MSAATIATVCAETAETMNRTALVMGKGIVELLASKYGFDAAEAFEAISFELPKKTKKAAEKKNKGADGSDADASDKGGKKKSKKTGPAMPLPFVGIVKAEWCMGIRTNQGLFTQCTQAKPTDGGEYCPTCKKQADANASGKPTYGNINDRVAALEAGTEWRDPKENKAVAHYANVAAKLKIDLEAAKAECLSVFGVAIPDDQLEVKATQRGRPKKDTTVSAIVSDTDSAASSEKKKGRPKKVKTVIEGGAAGEDMIAYLVAQAQNGEAKSKKAKVELTEEEKQAKKKAAAEKRAATLAEKKANQPPKPELSDEEKAAKRKEAAEKRKAAAEAKQAAYIQAAVQAALVAQGLSSAAPSTVGSSGSESTTPVKKAVVPEPVVDDSDDEELQIEELQQEEVEEWDCPTDGKTYLKSTNNVLYDIDTQDEVGVWNESKQMIERLTTVDDDEDDMC